MDSAYMSARFYRVTQIEANRSGTYYNRIYKQSDQQENTDSYFKIKKFAFNTLRFIISG